MCAPAIFANFDPAMPQIVLAPQNQCRRNKFGQLTWCHAIYGHWDQDQHHCNIDKLVVSRHQERHKHRYTMTNKILKAFKSVQWKSSIRVTEGSPNKIKWKGPRNYLEFKLVTLISVIQRSCTDSWDEALQCFESAAAVLLPFGVVYAVSAEGQRM